MLHQPKLITLRRKTSTFVFDSHNFVSPNLPANLKVRDVQISPTSELSKVGARLIESPDDITTEKGNFDIVKWPVLGWRSLDPETGDEAGTTEGPFEVAWQGDHYFAHNLAIASSNNKYLDGLGALPEKSSAEDPRSGTGNCIFLWMSDYHPDGGQLFWPETPIPFVVCLGSATVGDDISPCDMRAFAIPAGKGVYISPGTWHNGVYAHGDHCPVRFLTRQGRVHARVSCSWAAEFGVLLRVPLVR